MSPSPLRRRRSPERGEPGWLQGVVLDAHPRLSEAIAADVGAALRYRGEVDRRPRTRAGVVREAVRLAVVSDAFLGQALYRARARARARRGPVVPHVLHRLTMATAQICIGDPVVVEPGVYIPHGQVVVDGFTRVGRGAVLSPFVTVGLKAGQPIGPTLDEDVHLGTGAKVIGPIRVGAGARVGANAVVLDDVEARATVVGAPARPLG